MPCQLLIWLVRRLMRSNRPRPPRDLPPARPRIHAPIDARLQDPAQPPSYDHLFPRPRDGREDLETLRARHPPKHQLNAPIPTDSPTKAAYLAGTTAFPGLAIARDETHPYMIIARTAQAIAIAASTSQSHAVLLAAVNTMESLAILCYEGECGPIAFDDEDGPQIVFNFIDTPVRRALAQKPPSNSFIPHYEPLPAVLTSADTNPAHRAFLEALMLNMHILRPLM